MTRLRQRMLEDMQLRGLAQRTQEAYLSAVQHLALHYGKSPDLITEDELRLYFLFLCNQKRLAPNTTNVALNGIKFFYTYTLQRPWPLRDLIRPPIPQKLPVVLAPEEVWRIVEQVRRPDYRVCLSVISACGLRLLEGVRLQVSQIDSARMQLHIRSGKGNKDRAVPLPPKTLTLLRAHWRLHRNPIWLFPGTVLPGEQHASRPMEESALQKAFRKAVQAAGVSKPASIHSLRHSWATHLLESGVSVRVLQLWMGHTSPTTTAIYTHLTQHAEQAAATALERLTAGLP
ncbi:MAG TPA: site-specific integrase [Pyrinomonadaceae bacterium]